MVEFLTKFLTFIASLEIILNKRRSNVEELQRMYNVIITVTIIIRLKQITITVEKITIVFYASVPFIQRFYMLLGF